MASAETVFSKDYLIDGDDNRKFENVFSSSIHFLCCYLPLHLLIIPFILHSGDQIRCSLFTALNCNLSATCNRHKYIIITTIINVITVEKKKVQVVQVQGTKIRFLFVHYIIFFVLKTDHKDGWVHGMVLYPSPLIWYFEFGCVLRSLGCSRESTDLHRPLHAQTQ